jgi:hypothetical protein
MLSMKVTFRQKRKSAVIDIIRQHKKSLLKYTELR